MSTKFFDQKGAFGNGTDNTDVIAYTADATPRIVQVPTAFVDQYVRITVVGTASLQYFFTSSSTAAIVAAVPSATGQQAATLGEPVNPGTTTKVRVPGNSGGKVYFAWVCSGAGTGVFITKDSGIPARLIGSE